MEKNVLGLSGLLPIYKPTGMISKDVSRILQRNFGKLKLGHVGTLDPLAEGVLPIVIGKATRLQDYLLTSEKIYDVDIAFGYQTDTLRRYWRSRQKIITTESQCPNRRNTGSLQR